MPPTDTVMRDWWPSTQALDLVEAPVELTAEAVHNVYNEIAAPAKATITWLHQDSLHAALATVPDFDNCVTRALVLPTKTRWSVIWYNTFLCSGFDSLCKRLSGHYRLTTIHFMANDHATTFQAGALFHLRAPKGGKMVERVIQTAQTDRQWSFHSQGLPLAEEDLAGYAAKRTRDRFNENRALDLLAALGAKPWDSASYAFPGKVAMIARPRPPACIVRERHEVLISAT
jgi:hypothetical protein